MAVESPMDDRTKRATWVNSFYLPVNANLGYVLMGGPGVVDGVSVSIGTGGGALTVLAGGQYAGTSTEIQAVYVDDSGDNSGSGLSGHAIPVSSIAPSFPSTSVPLAVLILDGVGRIQQIIDVRPSYLTSAPELLGGGIKESVADPTKRVYFQNNYAVPRTYALTPQIPQDLSLPSPGFLLGSGSVVLSGNVITTPSTYISARANKGVVLGNNTITQGYIDPTTGALTTRQAQTSGVFPNGSLPIFEATVDYVNLIRNLVDWRPSYI